MGIIKKGHYKYGNKTISTIPLLDTTHAKIGDMVYETTRGKRRYWDGNNWIDGHVKSMAYSTTEALDPNGQVVTIDPSTDNEVRITQGTAGLENNIGTLLYTKTDTAGEVLPVTYAGEVLIVADDINTGTFLEVGTVNGRCVTGSAAGVLGVWTGNSVTVPTISYGFYFGPNRL